MRIDQLAQSKAFLSEDKLADYRKAVVKQSKRHTQRRVGSTPVDIIETARPNESEGIKEYRAKNERQITRSGVEKFTSKVGRIITQGISFANADGDRLVEYLNGNPFYDTGNRYDFEGYLYGVILPLAFENPNLIWVAFPFNPLRPDIAPANFVDQGGLAEDEDLGINTLLIAPSFIDDESFAFVGGKRLIPDQNGRPAEVDFYFAADQDYWYTLEPSYRQRPNGSGMELIYTEQIWYRWDLGTSPVNLLPGSVAVTEFGKYRESFLRPYFALADEAINAFSDNQAIRVRFAHPAVGMEQIECYADGCDGGKVFLEGKRTNCSTCHGTGKVSTPGPYGTLVRPKPTMDSPAQNGGPLMEFYHPDVSIMRESWLTWVELLKMAKQEIGLDLLDGTGVESGRAKDLRLEDLHDLLSQIGQSLGACGEQMLQQLEALLNPRTADRKTPKSVLPVSYKILEASELKENAEVALFEDRLQARMDYYQHTYRGRPDQIRIYEIALSYAPAILLNEAELATRVASGGLTPADITKRDYAVAALRQLAKENRINLATVTNDAAFAQIDAYLTRRGLLVTPTPIFDAQTQPQ